MKFKGLAAIASVGAVFFVFSLLCTPVTIPVVQYTVYQDSAGIEVVGDTVTVKAPAKLTLSAKVNDPSLITEMSVILKGKKPANTIVLTATPSGEDELIVLGSCELAAPDTITAAVEVQSSGSSSRFTFIVKALEADPEDTIPTILNEKMLSAAGSPQKGKAFSLTVKATGTAPLSYTWFKDNVKLDNKVRDTLAFASLTDVDTGGYYVIVSNAAGSDISKTYRLSFTNRAPQWSDDTLLYTIPEDSLLTIALAGQCSDPDADPLSFTLESGSPAGDTITAAGNYVWKPGFTDAGTHLAGIVASDGAEEQAVVLKITVTNVNRAPVFVTDTPQVSYLVPEGGLLSIPFKAVDPDSQPVQYTLDSTTLPRSVVFDTAARSISWQSQINDSGLKKIYLTATDGTSKTQMVISVAIGNVNLPPRIAIDTCQRGHVFSVVETRTLQFTVTVIDPNNGDQPVLLKPLNLPAAAAFDSTSGLFSYTPDFTVSSQSANTCFENVSFLAADAASFDTFKVAITVLDSNRAPLFVTDTPQTSYQIDEQAALTVSFKAVDPDGDPVVYSLVSSTLPRAASIVFDTATRTLTWQSQLNDSGAAIIVIAASDGAAESKADIAVAIGKVNLPPVIAISGVQNGHEFSVTERTTLSFTVTVSDPNAGNTPVLLKARNLPPSSSYDTTSGVFSYTPEFSVSTKSINTKFAGIEFIATDKIDAAGFDTFTVSITVVDSNQTPVTHGDTATILEDATALIDVLANDTDADDDALTLLSMANGKNGTASIFQGKMLYAPNANFHGVDTIAYTARDEGGRTAIGQAVVTIVSVNDAPSFTRGANQGLTDASGSVTVAGWAQDISAGPADEAQQTLAFTLSVVSDTASILSSPPAIDVASGDLTFGIVDGGIGEAEISVTLSDNGGTASGGINTSAAVVLKISADTTVRNLCIAHWSFDELGTNTFTDVTGNGFDATTGGQGRAAGVVGQALDCQGTDYDLYVQNSVGAFAFPHFTVESWFKSSIVPGSKGGDHQKIFCNVSAISGLAAGYNLFLDGNGNVQLSIGRADTYGWISLTDDTPLSIDTWYHIVGTYDGSEMKIYLNGEQKGSQPFTGGYEVPITNARIGMLALTDSTLMSFADGQIDELRVYNYALPIDSILAHYNSEKP